VKRLIVAAGLLALACLGCSQGPPLGSVTGTVTLDGKPLGNVLVTFNPNEGGGSSTGTTDSAGKYELVHTDRKGAVLGMHKVTVTALVEAPPVVPMSSDDPNYAKQGTAGYTAKKPAIVIPARYNSSTELSHEVKSGSNEYNLELKSS
jgi:hypothetical protein